MSSMDATSPMQDTTTTDSSMQDTTTPTP
jgi:hypothetical protein